MPKATRTFVCQSCGSVYPRWNGKCEACGAWNTIVEEVSAAPPPGPAGKSTKGSRAIALQPLSDPVVAGQRIITGNGEFDRVTGGGLMPGSVTLIGGDPGIGKSTLLLQIMAALSTDHRCAYVSGEEAADQIRLRAERLSVREAPLLLAAETNVMNIVATLNQKDGPDVVVVDSIQTLYVPAIDSVPGTVSQVRTSTQELIRAAKARNIPVIIVGHVTKDGAIAGPKVLEHMVDTVLYFEGDRGHPFRILRAVKNRFGPTDEIGVYDMSSRGLAEVPNPSGLFLSDRADDVAGSTVFAGMEGTRPLLVEIQALVAPSPLGMPRRTTVGWDSGRLAMLLAVLETRAGISFSNRDVYLNVAGGFRVTEPAADLCVAAALVSAITGRPAPDKSVFFGEVGLAGDIRPVPHMDQRMKESAKLGFATLVAPPDRKNAPPQGITFIPVNHVKDLADVFGQNTQVRSNQRDTLPA